MERGRLARWNGLGHTPWGWTEDEGRCLLDDYPPNVDDKMDTEGRLGLYIYENECPDGQRSELQTTINQ